jgi:hypothetical protein
MKNQAYSCGLEAALAVIGAKWGTKHMKRIAARKLEGATIAAHQMLS